MDEHIIQIWIMNVIPFIIAIKNLIFNLIRIAI